VPAAAAQLFGASTFVVLGAALAVSAAAFLVMRSTRERSSAKASGVRLLRIRILTRRTTFGARRCRRLDPSKSRSSGPAGMPVPSVHYLQTFSMPNPLSAVRRASTLSVAASMRRHVCACSS
jgi:hypothetical protein